ncbi:DUF7124 domain-containing protein [Natrinema salifodinae]|uniref:DUF7124 domain-containing protein n=1 Tax=Natrinema salifodinae TaxID=1202768 RepID=A0A1I0PKP0_9EURY|nr:hypothetical protein [Natrinema salifodinae]SEW14805.1 hypothetical protein SAMN05216285_2661 [Natrinema salifodinae]
MTERIDLDDLDVETEDDETEESNPGDWFWRGEGDPDAEPTTRWSESEPDREAGETGETGEAASDANGATAGETGSDESGGDAPDPASQPAPRVPRSEAQKPAGIPTSGGGAGTGATGERREGAASGPRPAGSAAEGPHGGGVDDMTIAFTYRAVQRLAHPAAVFADAYGWSDWIGIVGDVGTPAITKFQREYSVDADFFTGSGTDPSERLQEIDRTSMFYAERMLVIGVDEDDEAIAEAADWEYLPLETAAEKADWELD